MIPGLGIIEKIIFFGIDFFMRRSASKSKLKQQFNAFFRKAGEGSKKSSDMQKDYRRMRRDKDLWDKKDE
jgi:hypothetical protein